MNMVGDDKNHPPKPKPNFRQKLGDPLPQIGEKFNIVQLSSNFQGRPGQKLKKVGDEKNYPF